MKLRLLADSNPSLSASTFVIFHLQAGDTYTESKGYTFFGRPPPGAVRYGRTMARHLGIRRDLKFPTRGRFATPKPEKFFNPSGIRNGRLYVSLSSDGFQRKCTVHSLVAAAFLGDCPPKHEITHKDGDYTNNAAENVEYVTRGENQKRFVMRSGGYSVNLTKRVQTANGMR